MLLKPDVFPVPKTEAERQRMVRRLKATLRDLENMRANAAHQASLVRYDLDVLDRLGREWRRNE